LATHLSAIKRARQAEKRRVRNLHIKTTEKSAVKGVRTAVERKDVEGAQKALFKPFHLSRKPDPRVFSRRILPQERFLG
jgi:ribosomal protein S20